MAATRPGILVIGDSIVRHIRHPKVFTKMMSGANIERVTHELHKNQWKYRHFRFIVLHVGTNDLHKGMVHLMDEFEKLVLFMKVNYSNCSVFFNTLLPRPRDLGYPQYHWVDEMNTYISRCVDHYEFGEVIFAHKAFLGKDEQPILALFSDRLHINTPPGVTKLTERIISALGEWCTRHNTTIQQQLART